jgi:HlyD family secretion protein
MKKKRVLAVVFALVILGGLAIGLYLHFFRASGPRASLRLYGNVDIRQVQLAFHDTGRIERILVEEGARVKGGQLLARLDPVRFEAAAARARAQTGAQEQVLSRLLAGSRPEEIAEAEAHVRSAEATLRDAEETFRRTKALAAKEYVPRQQFDDAEAALKSARAALEAASQVHTLAVKGPRKEDIATARAQLKADRAAQKLAERELADTKLFAPSDGVVQDRILEPGDMAFPQSPVLTLALTEPLWVRAYVDEPDLGRISPGMRAEITTDSFPGKTYKGWVGYISPTAEFTPKRVETSELRSKLVYQVRVFVCNPQNQLRLGMPATVDIPLKPTGPPVNLNSPDPCREQ